MIVQPCGHEIPQEMPEQTAALLEAFLSGLGQAAGTEAAAASMASMATGSKSFGQYRQEITSRNLGGTENGRPGRTPNL